MIDFLLRPWRRNFGPDKRFYAAIDDMFGFIPNNIELYKLALIHKSASVVMENGQHINNERLEFLGDAVIESVTSDYLFIEFPDKNEGFLTQLRSKMVSRQALNSVARRIGLDEYVISSTSGGSSQKHIFGDAFEAMMGAIYLDQGYDFVNRLLINKIFVNYLKLDTLVESETDFKSRLIEWCQKNHHTIRFVTAHDKNSSSSHPYFYSKVLIDGIEAGYGAGESKKEAEQRAAYSVSQGVSDDDCTKLLDKLDNLDRHLNNKKKRAEKAEKTDKSVVVEDKAMQTVDDTLVVQPSGEVVAAAPLTIEESPAEKPKRRAPRRRKSEKKEQSNDQNTDVQTIEEKTAPQEPTPIAETVENVEPEVKKPARKTRSSRAKSVKTSTANAENIAAEQVVITENLSKEEVAQVEASTQTAAAAERPKRVVRRRRKSESNEEPSR